MSGRILSEVDGLPVSVEGGGPDLVLLHGFTGSMDAWPVEAVESLRSSHRLWRVDLPGHGSSSIDPRAPRVWSVTRTLARLRRLAEHIGAPARWVGYSMGGRIALLAAAGGVPMESLRLESASPGLRNADDRATRRAADEERAAELDSVAGPGEFEEFVDRWMALPLFESQRRLSASTRQAERARRLDSTPAGWAAALRGFGTGAQPSMWSALPRLDLEVHLLTGALDEKFTGIAGRMVEGLPRAVHTIVPEAGHAVHLERPGAWVKWVVGSRD